MSERFSGYADYYRRMGFDDPPVLVLSTADRIQMWRRNASKLENSIDEIAREHRRKMEAEHVETMRGAKVGTWLLGALFVVAVYAAAQLAGFVP